MSLGLSELRRVAAGVTVLLVLVLLWGGGRVLFMSVPEPHLPAESSLRVAQAAVSDGEAALPADLTTRPLFWYGRKPYEPPAQEEVVTNEEPEEVPEMEIDKVQLVGVLGAGDQSGIIVTHAGESLRLGLDDQIEGWRFVGLSDDGARFTSSGRSRVLTMEHASPAAPSRKAGKSSEAKDDRKADKKSRGEERAKKRARKAESRKRDSGRGARERGRMTSVWGGPPKKAEPEKAADDKAQEQ